PVEGEVRVRDAHVAKHDGVALRSLGALGPLKLGRDAGGEGVSLAGERSGQRLTTGEVGAGHDERRLPFHFLLQLTQALEVAFSTTPQYAQGHETQKTARCPLVHPLQLVDGARRWSV